MEWKACEPVGANAARDRAKWLEARRTLIGASDVAAIMGLDKGPTGRTWRSALEVYTEKIGEDDGEAAGEIALWGNLLEPVILAEYGRRRARLVAPGGELMRSKRFPFLGCTPDGWEVHENALVQVKTTGWAEEWKGDTPGEIVVPLRHQVQVQAELLVTGAPRAVIVWLPLPERRLQWREILPHADFQNLIVEEAERFWQRVLDRQPPPPDGSESAGDALRRLYPEDDGTAVDLDDRWLELATQWEEAGAAEREAKKHRDVIKQQLAAELKDASLGRLSDGRTLSYKAQTKAKYTCEGCGLSPRSEPFRVLRVQHPKGGRRGAL